MILKNALNSHILYFHYCLIFVNFNLGENNFKFAPKGFLLSYLLTKFISLLFYLHFY